MSDANRIRIPAFPEHGLSGMDLRDYFAAKAMQSILITHKQHAEEISRLAYLVADAMLKAREA